ncbi:GntR family transcriptional regulator [Streptomyces sp. NPDC005438]|uniref:GntR family transcriptional regulator n=1 Tax=Streptomyces sp. NPDC005438 TaxID=3156880 RepID=UPI0033B51693
MAETEDQRESEETSTDDREERPGTASSLVSRVLSRAKSLEGQGVLVGEIVTELATEIIEGRLDAGYDLTSVNLGRRFGTSRTPVHQALAVLQREGLVEVPPRKRARVATLTLEEIRDLYQIRSTLYSLMSQEIVAGATDEQIARLDEPLAAMREAVEQGDTLGYFYLTVDYRHIEADICPNQRVGSIIESLGLRIYRLRRYGLSLPNRMRTSSVDYARLREAYGERDRDLASAVTRAMMRKALTVIEANWEREPVPHSPNSRAHKGS